MKMKSRPRSARSEGALDQQGRVVGGRPVDLKLSLRSLGCQRQGKQREGQHPAQHAQINRRPFCPAHGYRPPEKRSPTRLAIARAVTGLINAGEYEQILANGYSHCPEAADDLG